MNIKKIIHEILFVTKREKEFHNKQLKVAEKSDQRNQHLKAHKPFTSSLKAMTDKTESLLFYERYTTLNWVLKGIIMMLVVIGIYAYNPHLAIFPVMFTVAALLASGNFNDSKEIFMRRKVLVPEMIEVYRTQLEEAKKHGEELVIELVAMQNNDLPVIKKQVSADPRFHPVLKYIDESEHQEYWTEHKEKYIEEQQKLIRYNKMIITCCTEELQFLNSVMKL